MQFHVNNLKKKMSNTASRKKKNPYNFCQRMSKKNNLHYLLIWFQNSGVLKYSNKNTKEIFKNCNINDSQMKFFNPMG